MPPTTPPTDSATDNIANQIHEVGNLADGVNILSGFIEKAGGLWEIVGEKAFNALGVKTKKGIEELKNALTGDLPNALANIAKNAANMGDAITVQFKDGGSSINNLTNSSDKLLERFTKMASFKSLTPMFDDMKDVVAPTITTTTSNLQSLENVASSLGLTIGKDVISMLGKMGDNLIANAAQAEKFENAFVAMSSAAGNMNELFEGGNLVDLSAKTQNYANQIKDVGDATNQGFSETMHFANALKQLPGFLDQTVSSTSKVSGTTNALTSAMTLMSGTGRSQKEIIDTLNLAYDKLGTSTGKVTNAAQKGAEFLADVSSVANTLNLKFTDVNTTMDNIAETFKYVGDNSNDAAKVLARYTDALRETGLTGKASMDIVEGMTKSIHEMTTGTKAFLSLRSGGPGGLQGSFQIDQLLRQGKLDQVAQMAEKALRQQFNGRIYTQEEAASSPQAAAQFQRQRSLLQSGAFGIGKNANDEQATRLLEALGKRDFGTVSRELKTGQAAVGEATDRGKQLQDRNANVIKDIQRNLERATVAVELSAGLQLKQLAGTGTPGSSIDKQLREGMRKAGVRSDIDVANAKDATTPQAYMKESILSLRQVYSQALKEAGLVKDVAQNVGREGIQGAGDLVNDLREAMGKGNVSPEDRVMDRTITQPHRTLMQPDKPSQNVLKIPDTTIAAKYNPQGLPSRMPTVAEANKNPEMAAQRKKMMQEDQDRKSGIYNDAVHKAGYNQHAPTTAATTTREALKAQAETKQLPPQKVILEISAPPGFNVHKKSAPNNIEVMNGAAAGTNNGRSSDPGY